MSTLRNELLKLREAIGRRAGLQEAQLSELLQERDPRRAYALILGGRRRPHTSDQSSRLRSFELEIPNASRPVARVGFILSAVFVGGVALLPVVHDDLAVPVQSAAVTLLVIGFGLLIGMALSRSRRAGTSSVASTIKPGSRRNPS